MKVELMVEKKQLLQADILQEYQTLLPRELRQQVLQVMQKDVQLADLLTYMKQSPSDREDQNQKKIETFDQLEYIVSLYFIQK